MITIPAAQLAEGSRWFHLTNSQGLTGSPPSRQDLFWPGRGSDSFGCANRSPKLREVEAVGEAVMGDTLIAVRRQIGTLVAPCRRPVILLRDP
jgi:hypothetical protein